MYNFIKKNCDMLGMQNYQLLKMDVFAFLNTATTSFDFIFAGPPYALGPIDEIPRIIEQKGLIAKAGFFVLEHTPRNQYEKMQSFSFQRNYGTTVFSFFVNKD